MYIYYLYISQKHTNFSGETGTKDEKWPMYLIWNTIYFKETNIHVYKLWGTREAEAGG